MALVGAFAGIVGFAAPLSGNDRSPPAPALCQAPGSENTGATLGPEASKAGLDEPFPVGRLESRPR
jgi:hypothetical protein